MRNHNGQINQFKKLNIIQKLLEKYRERQQFTGFNPFQNKKQFRRTREQPQMRRQDIRQQFQNQTTNQYLKYNQQAVVNDFQNKAQKYKQQTNDLVDFSLNVQSLIVNRQFGYFKAKNQEFAQYIKEEEDVKSKETVNTTQMKKYSNSQEQTYDFNKIFQKMRKKDDDDQNNIVINEGDIPLIEQLSDINKINQFEEISKTFFYYNKIQSVEAQLKKTKGYLIEIKRQSLIYGDNIHNINVQFARDMSSLSRKPPTDLSNLTSNELTIVPTELRFCDLLNISSGRLNNKNITLCVRNSAVTKQDLEYQRSVLQKLQKKNKQFQDYSAGAGDQDIIDKKDNEQGMQQKQINTNQLELIDTDRLVNDINVLKKKIKDNAISSNNKEYQGQFQGKLQILLDKILQNTQFHNPMEVIFNLKHYCTRIEGLTRSGFDKRKLLWFYSDCMRYFQLAQIDQNIKYLIDKMAKQKTTTKTVIHQIIDPANMRGKPFTMVSKSKMLKKDGQPPKSTFRMRQFHQLPIKTIKKDLTPNKTVKKDLTPNKR